MPDTKIRLNLVDTFSHCTDSRTLTVDAKKLAQIKTLHLNQVPCPEFTNNINFSWLIEEIEFLN